MTLHRVASIQIPLDGLLLMVRVQAVEVGEETAVLLLCAGISSLSLSCIECVIFGEVGVSRCRGTTEARGMLCPSRRRCSSAQRAPGGLAKATRARRIPAKSGRPSRGNEPVDVTSQYFSLEPPVYSRSRWGDFSRAAVRPQRPRRVAKSIQGPMDIQLIHSAHLWIDLIWEVCHVSIWILSQMSVRVDHRARPSEHSSSTRQCS